MGSGSSALGPESCWFMGIKNTSVTNTATTASRTRTINRSFLPFTRESLPRCPRSGSRCSAAYDGGMTTASTAPSTRVPTAADPLDLIDVDHVRYWVGNAKQAAFFYATAFGFQVEEISISPPGIGRRLPTCSPRATSASCWKRRCPRTTRLRRRSAGTATASRTSSSRLRRGEGLQGGAEERRRERIRAPRSLGWQWHGGDGGHQGVRPRGTVLCQPPRQVRAAGGEARRALHAGLPQDRRFLRSTSTTSAIPVA